MARAGGGGVLWRSMFTRTPRFRVPQILMNGPVRLRIADLPSLTYQCANKSKLYIVRFHFSRPLTVAPGAGCASLSNKSSDSA